MKSFAVRDVVEFSLFGVLPGSVRGIHDTSVSLSGLGPSPAPDADVSCDDENGEEIEGEENAGRQVPASELNLPGEGLEHALGGEERGVRVAGRAVGVGRSVAGEASVMAVGAGGTRTVGDDVRVLGTVGHAATVQEVPLVGAFWKRAFLG